MNVFFWYNYQPDRSAVSPGIPTQFFFENRLYPENRSTGYPVVPPLPWICSSDTMFQLSARQICCFSRYTHRIFLRRSSVSGRTARQGVPPCHLFHGHVLLIQCSKYQPDRSSFSPDKPSQRFFDNRQYQIIWTECLVVPSLPWACSPDTRF